MSFMGDTKSGPFDVSGDQARGWLRLPANPNGRSNADVLKPWVNGMDLVRRSAGKWIVDFGSVMSDSDAALYEEPFRWVQEHVYPMRQRTRTEVTRRYWWRHERPRPEMWAALGRLTRYVGTTLVSKHRVFTWFDVRICPSNTVIVIARDDDTTFGILHSRFHEVWSLRLGTSLEDRPRYTPSTTFETFPFPAGLTPDIPAGEYADDPVPGYPKRPVPRDEAAAKALKKRTLTNLYNARPQWLADAHEALDAAVAGAYGWSADISDDEVLRELLALNGGG